MHEFSLETAVEDMDEADLRSTLDEFMDKHAENVETFSTVEAECDEYSETVEALEGEVAEYSETEATLTEKFAEIVSAETDLFETDEVAERFSLGELITKADNLGAFSLSTETVEDGPDGDEAEEEGPTFSDKPGRAPAVSDGDRTAFREQAEADLKVVLGDF